MHEVQQDDMGDMFAMETIMHLGVRQVEGGITSDHSHWISQATLGMGRIRGNLHGRGMAVAHDNSLHVRRCLF